MSEIAASPGERWEIVPDESSDYIASFVLRDPPCELPDGVFLFVAGGVRYKATARRDGCLEIGHTFNAPFGHEGHDEDDEDWMHICDIDDMVAMVAILLALKEAATRHFDAAVRE